MMTGSTEFEVKLEVEPATLRRLNRLRLIKTLKQSPKQASQTTVYFDTANHRLRKKGLTLRVRRAGGRHVQTIKASGNSASIERNEWENEISGPAPDFAIIKGTPVEDLLTKKKSAASSSPPSKPAFAGLHIRCSHVNFGSTLSQKSA
jgi:triphosphatase